MGREELQAEGNIRGTGCEMGMSLASPRDKKNARACRGQRQMVRVEGQKVRRLNCVLRAEEATENSGWGWRRYDLYP